MSALHSVTPDETDPFRGFWDARQELGALRTFAHGRRACPWAVLGVALARVVGHVEPHYVLPPTVGGEVGLNLFVAITGPSGSGKGAATSAAKDAINFGIGARLAEPNIGSGEGIVHTYMRPTPAKNGEPVGVEVHNTRAVFHAAEVDTLAALKGRQGSTLLPVLRDAWMSDRLGFQNADPTRRLMLEPHTYRLCLVVGVQPERAGVLLDDAAGGTPQRFLWMPSTDPDMPAHKPHEPPPLRWQLNAATHVAGSSGRYRLPVCETASKEIDAAALARGRGEIDAQDGHRLLSQLKVGAALALLDARAEVAEEDWQLAAVVMRVSDSTRAAAQRNLQEASDRAEKARGTREGKRAVVAADVVSSAAIQRVAKLIRRKLTEAGEWTAGAAVRKWVASRDRQYCDEAIGRLLAVGEIESRPAESGTEGTQYRRSDDLR